MKKTWLIVALLALGVMAVNSFADVQNIRLSGDIRIRGYYLNGAAGGEEQAPQPTGFAAGSTVQKDAAFISQRTRVTVEADLEDHVLVVVTLSGESTWGSSDQPNNDAGAGTVLGDTLNRRFDIGISEAYVQLNQAFFSPATLKIGRQYLHYGNGLIISSVDQEINYDAARLVLDYYPLTIDLVGAQVVNNQTFGNTSDHLGSATLLFANARYEFSDSAIKSIEAYFGWLARSDSYIVPPTTRAYATLGQASPMIAGLRANVNLTDKISTWAEAAYEFGDNGFIDSGTLRAWMANAGVKIGLKDTQWTPTFNATYTVASGSDMSDPTANFVPWFDHVDGYNGYLFCPALNNIHIFNVGASVKPYENTTLAVQAYYYMKFDRDGFAGSNPNYDFGGASFTTWGTAGGDPTSGNLGWEIDTSLGYDYSKDVRAQLVYGVFIPGNSYTEQSDVSRVAHEVRAELNVKF